MKTNPSSHMLRICAFALAEILITLAIIGTIAAITIPAVITKMTKQKYVAALQKAYNTLKGVERGAILEYGLTKDWNWGLSTIDTFNTYYKAHFDVMTDCGNTEESGCFSDEEYVGLNKQVVWMSNFNNLLYYRITTSDGISYAYTKGMPPSMPNAFYVDVNGPKGPNQYGRDLFVFEVFTDFGIKPYGAFYSSYMQLEPNPDSVINAANAFGCNPEGGGVYCAAKVLAEGAMNY